jgi:phosphoglycolate phosphatase-like HAD superfamily hydrolase
MRYKLILWDFDGTLADTFGCSLRIYNDLADQHGFRRIDDPAGVRRLSTLAFLRRHNIPLLKVPTLVRAVLNAQRGQIADIRLFPGLSRVLRELHLAGCRLAILSSNRADNIRACLRANDVEAWFSAVHGYQRLLGKARGIRQVVRSARLTVRDVVYIGDEARDIEAARQAGVASLAVTWGYQARALLAEHGPDTMVDEPDELLPLLLGKTTDEG